MKTPDPISSGLSDFPERLFRSRTGKSILTARSWKKSTKQLPLRMPEPLRRRSLWTEMSILFWAAALADAVPAEMRRLVVQFALLPHGQRQLVGVVHGGVGRGRVKGMVRVHKAAQRKERPVGVGLVDEVDGAVRDPGGLVVFGIHVAGVDLRRAAGILVRGGGAVLFGQPSIPSMYSSILLSAASCSSMNTCVSFWERRTSS